MAIRELTTRWTHVNTDDSIPWKLAVLRYRTMQPNHTEAVLLLFVACEYSELAQHYGGIL